MSSKSTFRIFLKIIFHLIHIGLAVVVILIGEQCLEQMKTLENVENMAYNMVHLAAFFATHWNFAFQTIYFCLALPYDLLELCNKENGEFGKKLKRINDVFYGSIVYPKTLLIFGLFWSVFYYNREYVFPSKFDPLIPSWFNHILHTNILVAVCIENILEPRRYPEDAKLETKLAVGMGLVYTATAFGIYYVTGRWLYNIYLHITPIQRALLHLAVIISFYIFNKSLYFANRLVHGSVEDKPVEYKEEKSVEVVSNGIKKEEKYYPKVMISDYKTESRFQFSNDEEWSMRYRNLRTHFENYAGKGS